MPGPAEGANLAHNLGVLAGLRDAEDGVKLSYNATTGRFSAQTGGVLQSIARSFTKSESVTSRTHFADPILEIFAAARAQVRATTMPAATFDNALDGLRVLRTTYRDEAAKLATLNNVIQHAELGLRFDADTAVALRERHRNRILYGFYQGMFLPPENQGVCYSFVVDWARRTLVLGKKSFATSSKPEAYRPRLQLDLAEKRRILKKVDASIGLLHHEIGGYAASAFGTAVMTVGATSENPKLQRYGDLLIGPLDHRDNAIDERTSGSTVMNAVIAAAAGTITVHTKALYVFLLSVIKADRSGGHAVGFRFGGTSLHFFDPNLGEVYFETGPGDASNAFFDDWWTSFYQRRDGTNVYRLWGLEAIRTRPRAVD